MDTELVVQARHGDDAAFVRITEFTYPRLLGIAYRILRDRALAEDVAQDALVEAWRTLPALRDPSRFEAWTYRILVRACHREGRRSRTQTLRSIDEPSAPDEVAGIHERDQLERAFRRLTVDQRAVIVLHHYQDLTLEQVAEALGIPVGTAASRLSRAMSQLRRIMRAPDQRPATTVHEAAR
jgi:RNA polymerase sigma-70 factor (ECF subfamily)